MTKAKIRRRPGEPFIVRDGQSTIEPKLWSKETITQPDWDFTGLILKIEDEQRAYPKDMRWTLVYRALTWELDRELGSGNGPFLGNASWPLRLEPPAGTALTLFTARGEHRDFDVEPPPWPEEPVPVPVRMRSWPMGKFAGMLTPETRSARYGLSYIVPLEIPMDVEENELVESFRLFVRHHLKRQLISPPTRKSRPGRKREWRSSFDNLAIYRLSRCGYTYREAQELLKSGARTREQTLRKQAEEMVENAVKHFRRYQQDCRDPSFRFRCRIGFLDLENHARKVLHQRKQGQKTPALTDEQFNELLSGVQISLTDRRTLNAQEFSRATGKTEEAIKRRYKELRAWAEDWAKRLPKEAPRDWRDFFIKP